MGTEEKNYQDTLDRLMEIAEKLNDTKYVAQLAGMRQLLETSEFMVSVMGQFSAGKSRLLNQLIGREILPVDITETTAVVTLIKYAETEKAVLIAHDGSEKTVDLEESKKLRQDGAKEELEKIQTIVLYVHADLLASGLVLADTPGINTVIHGHIQQTAQIMEVSGMIIYVMRKPASDTDLRFLKEMKSTGLSVMLVRTHMDMLKSTEEDADHSIRKEQERMQPFSDVPVFFVSNEVQSAFYANVLRLKKYIQDTLSINLKQAAAEACAKRAAVIAARYLQQAREQEAACRQYLDGQKMEYQAQKKQLEAVLQRLEHTLSRNEKRIKSRQEQLRLEAGQQLQQAEQQAVRQLEDALVQESGCGAQDIRSITEDVLYQNYISMRDAYLEPYNQMMGENQAEICEQFADCLPEPNFQEYIPQNVDDTSDKIVKMRGEIAALHAAKEEYEQQIQRLDKQQAQAAEQRTGLQEELEKLLLQKQQVMEKLKGYPEYQVQYKIVQENAHSNEKRMKAVGAMLDWFTIFLSGGTFVQAGSQILDIAGNIVSGIPMASEPAAILSAAGQTLQKSDKIIETANQIDQVVDIAKVIKKSQDPCLQPENKKFFTKILDMLSFEHHLGNLGKKQDLEQMIEIDWEYEKQYYEQKNRIRSQMQQSVEDEMKKREQILDLDYAAKKEDMERTIRLKKQMQADLELQELERQLAQEKEKKKSEAIQAYCLSEGTKTLHRFYEVILKDLKPKMEECMADYITVCNAGVRERVQTQRHRLEELERLFHTSSKEELEKERETYMSYAAFLETLIQ